MLNKIPDEVILLAMAGSFWLVLLGGAFVSMHIIGAIPTITLGSLLGLFIGFMFQEE